MKVRTKFLFTVSNLSDIISSASVVSMTGVRLGPRPLR